MNFICSQALAAAFSAACSSAIAASVQSNRIPTRKRSSRPARTTGPSRRSPSFPTFELSTGDPGTALLTSWLAAFPARTSASRGLVRASAAPGLASGARWFASWARFDPSSCSWKTPQLSFIEASGSSLQTWPSSGSMRRGECYPLQTSTPRIVGIASGSSLEREWPTPTQDSATERSRRYAQGGLPLTAAVRQWPTPIARERWERWEIDATGRQGGASLGTVARLWPTPTASDGPKGSPNFLYRNGTLTLPAFAARFPTPASRDYRSPNAKPYSERGGGSKGEQLPNFIGGLLNPEWVEWLMGWPIGHTELGRLGMDKCREWRQQHSPCWQLHSAEAVVASCSP